MFQTFAKGIILSPYGFVDKELRFILFCQMEGIYGSEVF